MQASPYPAKILWRCKGDPRVARSPAWDRSIPNATNYPIAMDDVTHGCNGRARRPMSGSSSLIISG